MDHFVVRKGVLHAEGLPVSQLAEQFGTPLYVYSRATLERHYRAFDEALASVPHRVHYAVKANSNLAVLNVLARLGAGFDIVSGGELSRVLRAGGDPKKIVFSGVGKTIAEMQQALAAGVGCFNVESESELRRLAAVAEQAGVQAHIALRVNPDVDAKTHPYISTGLKNNKFGVSLSEAERLYLEAARLPGIRIAGIASHIGSQLLDATPLVDALDRMLALVDRLQAAGIWLTHIDVGGGLGVRYAPDAPPSLPVAEYVTAVREAFADFSGTFVFEPGRHLVAEAGVLLTRVLRTKPGAERPFLVVDAAMNDLLRPALYDAWHTLVPLRHSHGTQRYDVVGPVCESSDVFALDRDLPHCRAGDLVAVLGAGAYGASMASTYNSRPLPAEVMVDAGRHAVVRERQTFDAMIAGEHAAPDWRD